jgi:hypothetical protein
MSATLHSPRDRAPGPEPPHPSHHVRVTAILPALGRLLIAALTFRLVTYEIAEDSMLPALSPGDWVAGARRPRRIRPGNVVVFELRPGFEVVKRVGTPPPGAAGLWLVGDNPDAGSVDSRTIGPVPAHLVRAHVLLRYRPLPLRAP